jgi:hypothetical protein
MEHADYPHTPGTLYDCPACELEMARLAYVEITRGKRCPRDILRDADLLAPNRRLVEVALNAEQDAKDKGIPVRDALHQLSFNDQVKAAVASWICPDVASDWAGSIEDRMAARDAANDRERERRNDRVLDAADSYEPDDHSLEARQCRETAASIRDHRENKHRQAAWDLATRERELGDLARAAFAERDELRAEAEQLQEDHDWTAAAISAIAMRRAGEKGDELVFEEIEVARQRKEQVRLADEYRQANADYEASGTYAADQMTREEGQ